MFKEILNQKIYKIFLPILLYCLFIKFFIYFYLKDLSENLFLNQYFNKLFFSLIFVYFFSGLILYKFNFIKNLIYIFCFLYYNLIFLSENANIKITLKKFEENNKIKNFNYFRYYINCILIFLISFFAIVFVVNRTKNFSEEIDNNLNEIENKKQE